MNMRNARRIKRMTYLNGGLLRGLKIRRFYAIVDFSHGTKESERCSGYPSWSNVEG